MHSLDFYCGLRSITLKFVFKYLPNRSFLYIPLHVYTKFDGHWWLFGFWPLMHSKHQNKSKYQNSVSQKVGAIIVHKVHSYKEKIWNTYIAKSIIRVLMVVMRHFSKKLCYHLILWPWNFILLVKILCNYTLHYLKT